MAQTEARRDLRQEMQEETGEYPESWIPAVSDLLVGAVVRYETGTTSYGESPIAVIRDDETGRLRSFWLIHHVAREEFKKLRPRPGERVAVKRLPDAEKGYRRYRVLVDRDEPEVPDFNGATGDRFGHPDAQGDWKLRQLPSDAEDVDSGIPF